MTPFTHAPQLARLIGELGVLRAQIKAQAGDLPALAESAT